MPIPRIIHQIWIGPNPAPHRLMKTWKDKHPGFEYILWDEDEIRRRNLKLRCQAEFDMINEIVGKVDILRLEILYKYGGVYIDADSICINPLDGFFFEENAFATYENENIRNGLVATGTMGFCPKHPICNDMLCWIASAPSKEMINKFKAWYSVGPACLTRFLDTGKYTDFMVFPSYFFLPHHFTGVKYDGHRKIYAHQEWCNTDNKYSVINNASLPEDMRFPKIWVSILIASYNASKSHIHDCLSSICDQKGHFGMEIVWINDGSTLEATKELEEELLWFQMSTRFCTVAYKKLDYNCGLSYCLNQGVKMCSHPLIFRMDSDDIMHPMRIQKQMEFMDNNVDSMLCGTQIQMITDKKEKMGKTNHPEIIILEDFIQTPRHWFMNHPTICFRKNAILEIGNYNGKQTPDWILEDFELGLKVLKHFGKIYNLPDALLLYRLHAKQSTNVLKTDSAENRKLREKMIEDILKTSPS